MKSTVLKIVVTFLKNVGRNLKMEKNVATFYEMLTKNSWRNQHFLKMLEHFLKMLEEAFRKMLIKKSWSRKCWNIL
jgi:hypothetical protein